MHVAYASGVQSLQQWLTACHWHRPIAEVLRESQADKARFHLTALMHLQQRYAEAQAKLDRAYDDRIAGRITEALWMRRSGEWESELASGRREMARHEQASHNYAATGSAILELARKAHSLFVEQTPADQARLLRTLVSNSTFDRGSLSVTYVKPFDLLAEGNETENWLGDRETRCRLFGFFRVSSGFN